MSKVLRYWEIDLVRGIAILMMILFHTLFDLNFFNIFPVNVYSGFWRYFAFATASLFLLVVGISLTISWARAAPTISRTRLALKFVYRGAGIFLLGLLITLCTWLYLGEGFIVFGILHLIGVSIMISPLFFRLKKFTIIAGLLCIATGWIFTTITGPIWLLPLGIHPATFWSVDYEPIFPWFGMVLIGMGIGEYLYPEGVRRFTLPSLPQAAVQLLAFPGRHSLLIYLVHQPIIILLLAALTGTKVV
ncbi:MAG TPA: heparan-alpha-glucosaminide N-acetyltransferase [Methanoregula sp.]|nr:heparan-alpha-glucosaminide N-acetyltransferase [Methanoregula sp.]